MQGVGCEESASERPHVCAYCWAMRCPSQATRQERREPSMMTSTVAASPLAAARGEVHGIRAVAMNDSSEDDGENGSDSSRNVEQKALDGALARLSRLCEEMARNPYLPPNVGSPAVTQPAQIPVAVPSAEVRQLRARLAEVESERDVLAKKRALCRCLFPMFFRRTRASACWGIIRFLDSQ